MALGDGAAALNLATSAKSSKADVSPAVSVVAAADEVSVRCEVQTEANKVPPVEAYRGVTEAAASALAPYGVPVQVTLPVVTNASELGSAGIPVPGYVDLVCGAGAAATGLAVGFRRGLVPARGAARRRGGADRRPWPALGRPSRGR